MIAMSRFSLALLVAPVVVVVALAGCEYGQTCAAIGCSDGLNVQLNGNFEIGRSYQVDISTITVTPEVVPIMRCSLTRPTENGWDLRCNSAIPHSESFGNWIQMRTTEFKKLQVAVESDGITLGEQVLDVSYTSKEINGPGCGVCTSAVVNVTVP